MLEDELCVSSARVDTRLRTMGFVVFYCLTSQKKPRLNGILSALLQLLRWRREWRSEVLVSMFPTFLSSERRFLCRTQPAGA